MELPPSILELYAKVAMRDNDFNSRAQNVIIFVELRADVHHSSRIIVSSGKFSRTRGER